jgi:hypothetical protein
MASGMDSMCRARRPDDVRPDRDHASLEPREAGSRSQGETQTSQEVQGAVNQINGAFAALLLIFY